MFVIVGDDSFLGSDVDTTNLKLQHVSITKEEATIREWKKNS